MAVGRITSVPLQATGPVKTMSTSLAAKGKSRYPGTGVYYFPAKSLNGRYKIAFDDEDPALNNLEKSERDAEKKRRKEIRLKLEEKTGLDLRATSEFFDFTKSKGDNDDHHVKPVKLIDGDNFFDFKNPFNEINFNWLKVNPLIAPSYEAYKRGENGPGVQFYVYDEETEVKRNYDRKKEINSAVVKLDSMSVERRRKVARLMGLPVTDNTGESQVYNMIDNSLKESDFKEGQYKGLSTVRIFNQFADMENKLLSLKYVAQQAIDFNIYRVKDGSKVYEGEFKVADSKEDLIDKLGKEENQDLLMGLESKIKSRKIAAV